MKPTKFTPVVLAVFLHFAPLTARLAQSLPAFTASPTAIVLKWIVGVLAITGAYHTVSAATGLVSASTVSGTVGKRLTYQVKITGREVGLPDSWLVTGQLFNRPKTVTEGLPAGLSFTLSTMIISGTPTQEGAFDVDFTAYEHSNARGGALSFTLTFVIAPGATAPAITSQPVDTRLHAGELLTLNVTASSGSSLSYQWKHDGADVPGGTSALLTVAAAAASDAGNYVVVVSNANGTTTSATVKVVVVPLAMNIFRASDGSAELQLQTISGRTYVIEAASAVNSPTWDVVSQIAASGSTEIFTDSTPPGAQRFWRYHPAP